MYIDVRPHYLCQHNPTITQNLHLREQNLATLYAYKQSMSSSSLCSGLSMHAYTYPSYPNTTETQKTQWVSYHGMQSMEENRSNREQKYHVSCYNYSSRRLSQYYYSKWDKI